MVAVRLLHSLVVNCRATGRANCRSHKHPRISNTSERSKAAGFHLFPIIRAPAFRLNNGLQGWDGNAKLDGLAVCFG